MHCTRRGHEEAAAAGRVALVVSSSSTLPTNGSPARPYQQTLKAACMLRHGTTQRQTHPAAEQAASPTQYFDTLALIRVEGNFIILASFMHVSN